MRKSLALFAGPGLIKEIWETIKVLVLLTLFVGIILFHLFRFVSSGSTWYNNPYAEEAGVNIGRYGDP